MFLLKAQVPSQCFLQNAQTVPKDFMYLNYLLAIKT